MSEQHRVLERRIPPRTAPLRRVATRIALAITVMAGLMLPGAVRLPFIRVAGFAIAAAAGCRLILSLSYRPNVNAVTCLEEGMLVEYGPGDRLVAWDEIRTARSRPSFRVLELEVGSETLRIPHALEDFPRVLDELMQRKALQSSQSAGGEFMNPWTVPLLTGSALLTLPLSIYLYDGILLLAWGIFIWGFLTLLWLPRGVVVTNFAVELKRLLGRRVIDLGSIETAQLIFRSREAGAFRISVLMRSGQVEPIEVHSSKQLAVYSTLLRALHNADAERTPV